MRVKKAFQRMVQFLIQLLKMLGLMAGAQLKLLKGLAMPNKLKPNSQIWILRIMRRKGLKS